ncbi:uncharacterized protein J3D65DRAFT_688715 [Phyllosticta citribraziliensis]|uniref:N-acetyltransferase domain-containing protein n=1 Tax=Phyllosticta citribraziliensis TaxID=989973 RepID=A0ABR1L411_9PEZI
MGSPFMQDSPSDFLDPTDNPDAQNGTTTNAHAANGHVAPRGRNSPWRHLEDPHTGLPESGDFFEWINLIAYAESLGSSPAKGNQSASARSQELDNTLPNSSHAENVDDEQWDAFMNFEFSSPTGAGNTPPHAVDARYRYDSVQSNIEEPASPREGVDIADGHDSERSKILASANGPADSDAQAIMTDAARRNLLAAKFDFVDNFDDAEWRDFMEVATVDWSELDEVPADGNAQTNGNTESNDHNPMTNGDLPTDGTVLANGDNLQQDDEALAERSLSAEWNRLLADYDALENPHLTGNDSPLGGGSVPGNGGDTVVNGDQVMTDDIFAENPHFSVNNNPLEVVTHPVNGTNTMANGDHLDDNSPAHLYLPETNSFLRGGSSGNGEDAVLHGNYLMADDSVLANLYFPETDSFPGGGTVPGTGEDTFFNGNHLMVDANDLTNLHLPETDNFLGGGSPGNGEDAVLHGDHLMADANLTNGVHLQTADENVSANGILENTHVSAYDFDATDGFFSPMNTPSPTNGTNDNSRGNTLNFAITSCQQHERNALLSGIGVKPGYNVRNRSAKLSFWIAEPYWGRGIAKSAVGIFLRALFSRTLGLSRVTAYTLRRETASGWQGNFPARRVLWRNGFKREGCLIKSVFKFGEWWDQEVWAVLREDVLPEPNMTGAVSGGPVH